MKALSIVSTLLVLLVISAMSASASALYVDGIFNGGIDLGSGEKHFIMNFYGAEISLGPLLLAGEYGLGSQRGSDLGLRYMELKTGFRFIKKRNQNVYLSVSGMRFYGESDSFELDGILTGIDYIFTNDKNYYLSFSWSFIPLTPSAFDVNGAVVSENEGL